MSEGPRPASPWPPDPTSDPSRRIRRSWWMSIRMWLGVLLGGICLALALEGVDLGSVVTTLEATRLGWLAGAMLTVLLTGVAKTVRWHYLLAQAASPSKPQAIGLGQLTGIWLAGTAMNLALPAPRSGDLARAYMTGETSDISKSMVLGTIAAEKVLDSVMLAVCFLALVPVVALPEELAARQASVFGLALILLAAAAFLLWQPHRLVAAASWVVGMLPPRWGTPLLGSLQRGMQGLNALRQPRAILVLLGASAVIWAISAATNYLVFLALEQTASWTASFFLLVVLQAGVALPSLPGKVGVFQVLCRWALVFLGFSAGAGLAYGILLYLAAPVLLMLAGALALIWLSWRLRRAPSRVPALPSRNEEILRGQP